MNYKYSYKIASLKPNPDNINSGNIISFSSSVPSKDAMPIMEFNRIAKDIADEFPEALLTNDGALAFEPLKIFLRGLLFQKDILSDHDGIVITEGTKNALDIICRTLTNEGDTVICEEPISKGILNIFNANGLNVVGVPLNLDGMDTDRLESALIKNPNARFIYTIPNFQNPSGITASLEKRQEIYSIAHKYDMAVIEDDSYGDLRFIGADIPSIKSLDKDGRVIYINTFSNILSPSLKVGYICADSILTAKLSAFKKAIFGCGNLWSQIAICKFFDEFDYFDYTLKLSSYYRTKCELMLDNLKFDLPTSVSFTEPEGGFFILGTLPKGADVERFTKIALDKGVSICSGTDFITNNKIATNSFRLSISDVTEDDIIKGVKILGSVIKALAL